MLKGLQRELVNSGYVVSPNNIHALPGVIMYAGGPGVPDTKETVQVTSDTIRVYNLFTRETVATFSSVQAFFAWCPTMSEGGQPAHPQNWD